MVELALGPPGRFMPRSAAACVLPRATWHELQSDLLLCSGLGVAQVRPSYEPRVAAASAGPGAI